MTGNNVERVAAEDGIQGVECPVCGRDFDDDWSIVASYGDAWGGTGIESCPEEDCQGEIHVLY